MTTRRRGAPGPRRRAVLAWPVWFGAALAGPALAGCADTVPPADARAASRQSALRAGAAADSVSLLARYDATIAAHPALAARLTPLRTQVALHAQAFGAPPTASASPASASPSARPSASSSASSASPGATSSPSGPAVPGDPGAAVTALADAERRTAGTRTAALRDASPELARLLASVAACGAGHALLLQGGAS